MNRVIKAYSKLTPTLRDEVYMGYIEGDFERTSFPYKGNIVDGVICQYEDIIYLVPISTIVSGRSGSSDDLDDLDDDENSGIRPDLEENSDEE